MLAALLAELFETHRTHLLCVAYRMTGSVNAAESAVEESRLRLAAAHASEIHDPRVWLTGALSRICLDHLRTTAMHRETYAGQWLPEPVVLAREAGRDDPLEVTTRDRRFRLAELVALDSLSPAQRVGFVLHEDFSVPAAEIARVLELPVREVADDLDTARRVIAAVPPAVPDGVHEPAVLRLLAALTGGDLAAVVGALHPDAILIGDANGATSTAVNVVVGAEQVARFMLALVNVYGVGESGDALAQAEMAKVNGQLGLVLNSGSDLFDTYWHPARVIGFTVRDGSVWGTYDHANPAKMAGVRI